MILFILLLLIFIIILFLPLGMETIIHNNKITIYIMIFKIKFQVLKKDSLIDFEEKSTEKVKASKSYNIFKKKIHGNKNYLKKINFIDIIKKISIHLNLDLDINIKFGLQRKDLIALIYGILSALIPIISTLIYKFIPMKNFSCKVYPNFNKVFIDIKVINNIKTNLFKLLLIIFILVKEILRVRKIYKDN